MLICVCGSPGGSGGFTGVDPQNPSTTATKVVDTCDVLYTLAGESRCRCGQIRVISLCGPKGETTELSRTVLGEDCVALEDGKFEIVEKLAATELVWKAECVQTNLEISADDEQQTLTLQDLIQKAIQAGVTNFPCGEPVDTQCVVSELEVVLLQCGNEIGVDADLVTSSEAVILQENGCSINLDPAGSRLFKAQLGEPIQGFSGLQLSAGSAVAVCLTVCTWIQVQTETV